MRKHITHTVTILAAILLLAGCASTTLQSQWRDPGYAGGPFKKVFVIGLSARDVSARRIFEDAMVARLTAAGVQAVPEWQHLPGDGPLPEGSVSAAVEGTGADAVLIARLVSIDTRISVSPAIPGPGPGYGYGSYPPGFGYYPFVTTSFDRGRSRHQTLRMLLQDQFQLDRDGPYAYDRWDEPGLGPALAPFLNRGLPFPIQQYGRVIYR